MFFSLGRVDESSDVLLHCVCLVSQHLKDNDQISNSGFDNLAELNSR